MGPTLASGLPHKGTGVCSPSSPRLRLAPLASRGHSLPLPLRRPPGARSSGQNGAGSAVAAAAASSSSSISAATMMAAPAAVVAMDAADGDATQLPSMDEVLQQYGWMLDTPLEKLMKRAAELRDEARHGHIVSFSPKVFLPLTLLCRDTCGYCTFAQPPRPGRRAYMTIEEVLQVASLGAAAGCSEALLTLGDKPEARWPEAAAELAEMGYGSTLEYVEAAARAVLRETGLLPHINAGVMGEEQLRRLKQVSASQGLMLESTSAALLQPGGAHHGCPDKKPAARLATIEAAGRAAVPYTSGLLVGIGDTRPDRLHALACLHRLHAKYGHIQELIIQNFRAKPGTAMASAAEPPLEELLWAVAAARNMFGPDMNIQAPPNLTPPEPTNSNSSGSDGSSNSSSSSGDEERVARAAAMKALKASWRSLLDAGINDWGGISPITPDFVNPERPWPHLSPLAAATAFAGKLLLPRLPVYPPFVGLLASKHKPPAGSNTTSAANRMKTLSSTAGSSFSSFTTTASDDSNSPSTASDSSSGVSSESSSTSNGDGGGRPANAWLDFSGGRESIGAAVLRCADSEGFLRANEWVAGRADDDSRAGGGEGGGEGGEVAGDGEGRPGRAYGQQANEPTGQVQDEASPSGRSGGSSSSVGADGGSSNSSGGGLASLQSSVPLPRRRESRAWSVSVDVEGALERFAAPMDPSPRVVRLLDGVLAGGRPLQQHEIELLLRSRGTDHATVCAAADGLRAAVCGNNVTYVVNRNINYTNVCTYKCSFCAFSKGKAAEELRGPAYVVPYEEISRRAAEAWERGATEVCMQGGIHPDFTGDTYLRILAAAKAGAPGLHVHAFSPLEVHHGATTLGLSYEKYLERLVAAGLGSLPGTAAEVLDDSVRAVLCPDKISSATWQQVVSAAHRVGLRTTSTLMFGSVEEGPAAWAEHLVTLRRLQQQAEAASAAAGGRGGGVGFTEFVPLPFVHMEAPVYLQGRARRGPTLHEGVLLHAVARLALHPYITNIQASWVKMGPSRAARLLAAGCNDMGGSIMNETITRAAGASHGQELPPPRMESIILDAGRQPRQRTTLYGTVPQERKAASFVAAPLEPLVFAPPGSGLLL